MQRFLLRYVMRRLLLFEAFLGGMIATAAVTAAGATPLSENVHRPNFLFVFTDDQRHDALGCAGNPHVRTPHLDRLAARGVRFENAFVTLSICSPSRAAVLTGLYGSANGVTTLGRPLAPGLRTFAHQLKAAGWRTGMAGKWHLGTSPAECGFDFHPHFVSNGSYYDRAVVVDGKKQTVGGFIDDWVAERAIEFMAQAAADGQPFVMWMCTQVPHMDHTYDWNVRTETLATYDPATLPLPATWNDDLTGRPPYLKQARQRTQALQYGYDQPERIRRHLQRYYAAVTEVDAAIGGALNALDRLGLRENTYVLFMGDNGWFLGEHGMTSKVLPYEESMRVPMMIAGPGIQPGVSSKLVLNIDLPATMLELARLPIPKNLHGRSLVPLLRGDDPAWRTSFLYESPQAVLGAHPLRAVRTERWKYVITSDPADPTKVEFEELYDLQADPRELRNLATSDMHRRQIKELSALLESHLSQIRDRIAPGTE